MKELDDEHALALRWLSKETLREFEKLEMFPALEYLVNFGPIGACALLAKIYPFDAFVLCTWMRRTIRKEAIPKYENPEFQGDLKRKVKTLEAYHDILTRLSRLRVPHLANPPESLTPEDFLAWNNKVRN